MTDDATVLVVDDLASNRKLLEAVLTPRGFTVVPAASGQEALAILADRLPDVVLLDVLMPELDGYDTVRRIRADARTAFLPVVMVTASGEQERLVHDRYANVPTRRPQSGIVMPERALDRSACASAGRPGTTGQCEPVATMRL